MVDGEVIGTTKIADRWRISLIKNVRRVLEEQGYDIEEGDEISYLFKDGDIVVEPGYKPD